CICLPSFPAVMQRRRIFWAGETGQPAACFDGAEESFSAGVVECKSLVLVNRNCGRGQMRILIRSFGMRLGTVFAVVLLGLGAMNQAVAQSTYTSQLTGVVSDGTGAVIPGATVTL